MTEKFDLHISLTGAFRAEHRVWEVELGKIGISKGQPKMLGYLKHNDGCMQKDIAAGTGIEPPSATSILAVMERDGLVQRVQSEEDRRRYSVFLTPKGYEKAKQVEEISQNSARSCWQISARKNPAPCSLCWSGWRKMRRKASAADEPCPNDLRDPGRRQEPADG